jgi:hypothetical protein
MMHYKAQPLTNEDGSCAIRLQSIPVDAEIGAVGFRKQSITIVADDAIVVLKRGVPVSLHCPTFLAGSNYKLRIQLHNLDANGKRSTAVFRTGPLMNGIDLATEMPPLMLGPGAYECVVVVTVFRPDKVAVGIVEMDSNPRFTVLDSTDIQRFEIDVPQSRVDAAVAKLSSM